MKIIDISMPVTEKTVVWDDEFVPEIKEFGSISKGDIANSSYIKMSLHTATHIDFPRHFYDDGKTQENFLLETFYGKAYVVEINDDPIAYESFEKANIPSDIKKILIKTGSDRLYELGKFSKDFIALHNSGADWIVEKGIELVGIDYLSVEKYYNDNYYVHKKLLGNDILIIEGLNLSNVEAGEYTLYALPLKVFGRDAAPVRAFLIKE